jgi:diguanylate cyclase (GGDEF)-like protein
MATRNRRTRSQYIGRGPQGAGRRHALDEVTGLPTREAFLAELALAISSGTGTLVFVALDDFQHINDFLGHVSGNQVLRGVAERLQQLAGTDAVVARLTGVEFAMLMPQLATEDEGSVFAEGILHELQRQAIKFDDAFEVDIPAVIGLARYPSDGVEPSQIMRHADLALAQARGSNARYQFYRQQLSDRSARLRLIKLELRHALERDQLRVFYQPKVDLKSRRIVGMEALLRWQHPEHEMIPPVEFIPVAERTGLISPISDWMMREACTQTRRWKDAGLADLRLAVNLSTVQFRRQSVIASVTSILEDTGLAPEKLEVEVTESVLVSDDTMVMDTFRWFKELGIPIAIDDFGTGYSSLSYLMRFPASTVKIDASFIKNLHRSEEGATITRSIITLAHSLGMHVVAEGVELDRHVDFLLDHDCDIGQGYLFSRPVPAPEFEALLARVQGHLAAGAASTA